MLTAMALVDFMMIEAPSTVQVAALEELFPQRLGSSSGQIYAGHRAGQCLKEEPSMKHTICSTLAVATLFVGLAVPAAVPAAPAPKPGPAPAAAPVPEPHPEIREAIASLRHARMHMNEAAHDFGGHRVEALRATDEAIRQLELCLKFER